MLWNEDSRLIVEILTTNEYSIHVLVKVPTNSSTFLLTTIYASTNFNKHKILWQYLQELSPSVRMP